MLQDKGRQNPADAPQRDHLKNGQKLGWFHSGSKPFDASNGYAGNLKYASHDSHSLRSRDDPRTN